MSPRKTRITPGLLADLNPLLFRHEPGELLVLKECNDCGKVSACESLEVYEGTLKSLLGRKVQLSSDRLDWCRCDDPPGWWSIVTRRNGASVVPGTEKEGELL